MQQTLSFKLGNTVGQNKNKRRYMDNFNKPLDKNYTGNGSTNDPPV